MKSLADTGGFFYVGLADDLAARLVKHNAGVPHSAKSRPRRVKTAIAFRDRAKAAAFENTSNLLRGGRSPRNAFKQRSTDFLRSLTSLVASVLQRCPSGVLGGNRTHNRLLRRQELYPVELRGQLTAAY